ncbi:MAG: hypothetical protein IBX71_06690 [Candidatus Desulforudis sp.]|nr:hypothetical protein [Desulforudis sp.]
MLNACFLPQICCIAILNNPALTSSYHRFSKFEPPTSLLVYTGKLTDRLDETKSVQNLFYFLNACVREMELVAVTVGKVALGDIDRTDLVALDPFLAKALNVDFGFISPDRQDDFFRGVAQVDGLHPEPAEAVTH